MYHPRHSSFQLNDSLILIVGGDNGNWEIFNLNKQQSTYIGYSDIDWFLQSVLRLANNDIVKIGGAIFHGMVLDLTDKSAIFRFNISSIKDKKAVQIRNFELFQNYPNPFNPNTTIKYDLPHDVDIILTVYNIQGQKVRELEKGFKPAGSYQVMFDGSDLASGVYFYELESGEFTDVKRMLLIK